MDVLKYIKDLFGPKHTPCKRRCEPAFDSPTECKIRRRDLMGNTFSSILDDNSKRISPTSPTMSRNFLLDPIKTKFDYAKLGPPIVIPGDDDDDDCFEVKTPDSERFNKHSSVVFKNNATSTPLIHKRKNGSTDNVPFPKGPSFVNQERRSLSSVFLHKTTPVKENGKRPPKFNSVRDLKLFNKPRRLSIKSSRPSRETILNESFRPADRLQYEQLLCGALPQSNANRIFDSASFQQYIANSDIFANRSKRMVEYGRRKNSVNNTPITFVDLTTSSKSSSSSTNRISTRESIIKVLDDLDSENNKDSDSDVEVILPRPPSPKPDIQVDRVNSLKSLDPEDRFHSDWVKNLILRSKIEREEREKNISTQENHLKKLNEINDELRIRSLDLSVKRCLHIKDVILPEDEKSLDVPLPTLTSEQESIINNAINKRLNREEVLSKKFSLAITRSHMLTLSGLEWLNDEVINFYMNMIIERGKLDKYPSVHAMNTFFYMRLNEVGFSGVKRWSRKYDIFSFDLMVVPIHLQMHWCMAIVDFRVKQINYYDSMGKPNNHCLEVLFKYLIEEHLDKKKTPFDKSGWKVSNVKDIPQQMNGSDCGMFACTFAEYLSRDSPITFAQENMPYMRRKAIIEIIEGKLLIS